MQREIEVKNEQDWDMSDDVMYFNVAETEKVLGVLLTMYNMSQKKLDKDYLEKKLISIFTEQCRP